MYVSILTYGPMILQRDQPLTHGAAHYPTIPDPNDDDDDVDPLDQIDPDLHFLNDLQCKSQFILPSQFSPSLPSKKYFSLFHCNIRSARSNFDALSLLLSELDFNFSVIGCTETWLQAQNAELFTFPLYKAFHLCRSAQRRGGGVALYVNCAFNAQSRHDLDLNEEHCQCLCVEISNAISIHGGCTSTNAIVILVYRPPGSSLDNFIQSLNELLPKARRISSVIFMMGDFNVHMNCYDSDPQAQRFLDLMHAHFMRPLIDQPTRITPTSRYTIDNVFTNHTQQNIECGILMTDLSDHLPIFSLIPCTRNIIAYETAHICRVYSQRSRHRFTDQLKMLNWDLVTSTHDTEQALSLFSEHFQEIHDNCFPFKQLKSNANGNVKKPWINQDLRSLLRRKNKAYAVLKKRPTLYNEIRYATLKRSAKMLLKHAEKSYYCEQIEVNKTNMKATWRILNDLAGKAPRNTIPNKMQNGDASFTSPEPIAEAFVDYFSKIGRDICESIACTQSDPSAFLSGNYPQSLFLEPTTELEVLSIITQMRNSSAGHDALRPQLLKENGDSFVKPITHIVNLSLSQGVVPDALKIAQITPVYKAGDCSCINNYRPISVLTALSKILEKIVSKRVTSFLDKHSVISNNQFGFRRRHSCELPLVLATDYIRKALDEGHHVIGVFLDLQKAFDVVSHQILLRKLSHYGIRGLPLRWFTSYLSNRKQSVKVNGVLSSQRAVTHGVPQGSVLGPLLFLLYVNDLTVFTRTENLKLLLFADDTTLLIRHKNVDDLLALTNSELSHMSNWFATNKLSLNIDKTKYIFLPFTIMLVTYLLMFQ